MSESSLWRYVKHGMGNRWDATRHEDGAPGTPDVSFGCNNINGWIELKILEDWPKRPGTIVRIRHFTAIQRLWLNHRELHGGHCFVLLRVRREYLLFDAQAAGRTINKEPRSKLINSAMGYWKNSMNWDAFTTIITRRN